MRTRLATLLALLLLAGCGGDGDNATTNTTTTATTTTEPTTTTPEETTSLRIYLLLNGKVQPVAREVPKTQAVARAALDQLVAGPTTTEGELGLSTALGGTAFESVSISKGVAHPEGVISLKPRALAQTVYTLTQFPTVKSVEIAGKTYTRGDMEDFTPAILVESPLPFQTVANPLRAKGTANTFEANFQYEVVEPEGRIVDSTFVTATSGSGQRGTFDFTSGPYEISRPGLGALVVFELSAKDGSRIHLVEIPVQMDE